MRFIVAYTIKHNDIPDTWEEHYTIIDDQESPMSNGLAQAHRLFDIIKNENSMMIPEGWHLWTASISEIIKSID